MQIVVNVSDDLYNSIINGKRPGGCVTEMIEAIKNGDQLPKEHGRLVDADKIISDGTNKGFCDWYDEIQYADTILEANKGDEINEETKEEQEWWEM